MFWKRTSAPPSGLTASIPPSPDDHRSAAETVAQLLATYAQFVFDTEDSPAWQAREHCSDWSARVLGSAPNPRSGLQAGAAAHRVDWPGLIAFFSEHRRGERASVGTARDDLGETIRAFSRVFHEMLRTELRRDETTLKVMIRLSTGLGSEDTTQVVAAAAQLVELVQRESSERNALTDHRLSVLRGAVRRLEHQVQGCRNVFSLNPVTRLHNESALTEHLEFLAATGALFECPPCLLRFQVEPLDEAPGAEPVNALQREFADLLLRTFFAREHYVAHPSTWTFNVVLAGIPLGAAHALALDFLGKAEAQLRSAVTSAVLASLVAGESGAEWLSRTRHAANGGTGPRLTLAEVPGRFET